MQFYFVTFFFFALFIPLLRINALDQCRLNFMDCGTGQCARKLGGNRCQCPRGLMGAGCQRPCQDVYKSCERWSRERRCTTKLTSFFRDNCALTCQMCESDGTKLRLALHTALEPLAWLVGRWEAQIRSRYRFPILKSAPTNYTEVMDIQIAEPSMFDRPTLNYSVISVSLDSPTDIHLQLGFVALNSPVQELDSQQARTSNQVAIAMSSNTGLNIIEEGILAGNVLYLETKHTVSIEGGHFLPVKRRLALAETHLLDEQLVFINAEGKKRRFAKRFRRVHDYLSAVERS